MLPLIAIAREAGTLAPDAREVLELPTTARPALELPTAILEDRRIITMAAPQ